MRSFTSPDDVTCIDHVAFRGCINLASINIPASVTSIGESAFAETGLTFLTIPKTVTDIWTGAFANCPNLKTVVVEDSPEYIHQSQPNDELMGWNHWYLMPGMFDQTPVEYLYLGRDGTYSLGEALTSVEVGVDFQHLTDHDNLFSKCYGLKKVIIPGSVIKIWKGTFLRCTDLETVYVRRQEPPELEQYSFSSESYPKAEIHVPKGSGKAYREAPYWCNFANIIDDLDVSGIEDVNTDDDSTEIEVFNMQGQMMLRTTDVEELKSLTPGIYLKKKGRHTEKVVVK